MKCKPLASQSQRPSAYPTSSHVTEGQQPQQSRKHDYLKIAAICGVALCAIGGLSWLLTPPQPPAPPSVQCIYGQANGQTYDLNYYQEAAKTNREAAYCLAQMYRTGKNGVEKSLINAFDALRHSVILGCERAHIEYHSWVDRVMTQYFDHTLNPEEIPLARHIWNINQLSNRS
jgi:hypothetical protein